MIILLFTLLFLVTLGEEISVGAVVVVEEEIVEDIVAVAVAGIAVAVAAAFVDAAAVVEDCK